MASSNVILRSDTSQRKSRRTCQRTDPPWKPQLQTSVPKLVLPLCPCQGQDLQNIISSSDWVQSQTINALDAKKDPECTAEFLKTVGPLLCRKKLSRAIITGPNAWMEAVGPKQWRSDLNTVLCPPPNVTLPASLGRRLGRGEDLLSWKGSRAGMRGRGRGRGHVVPYVLNRNADYQKQQQLCWITNSSTIIQVSTAVSACLLCSSRCVSGADVGVHIFSPVTQSVTQGCFSEPPWRHRKDYSLPTTVSSAPQAWETHSRYVFKNSSS